MTGCSFPEYKFALGDGPEDCDNGIDDNGDGAVDCDDSSCVCPGGLLRGGWFGPVAVFAGDPVAVPSNCPSSGSYTGELTTIRTDPQGAPATCGKCQCELHEATCQARADYDSADCSRRDGECSVGQFCDIPLKNSDCNEIDLGQDGEAQPPQSLNINATFAGICAASEPTEIAPPEVVWRTAAVRCEMELDSKMTLVPGEALRASAPPKGFSVCIYQEGDLKCPSQDYRKDLYYGRFDDSRGCSPCSCGQPDQARCQGEVSDYPGAGDCSGGAPTTFDLAQASCVDVADTGSTTASGGIRGLRVELEAVATCAVGACEPVGSVEPASPSTYCCVE